MPIGKILLNNDEEDKIGMEDSGEYEDFPQVNFKLEKSKLFVYIFLNEGTHSVGSLLPSPL